MPQLPRHAVDKDSVRFNLRLQDVPGLAGEPYPNTEWRVVRAGSENGALGSELVVLTGRSDNDGYLSLTPSQEDTLHAEYNRTPNSIWIVANSHARLLEINLVNPSWTDADKFYHGLNALGYSDEFGKTNGRVLEDFCAPLARTELATANGKRLLAKLKKGSS